MSEVAVLGIDLGKTSCSVAGMSAGGQVVFDEDVLELHERLAKPTPGRKRARL
jgi:molecular chaperone DnaK (HSP70)